MRFVATYDGDRFDVAVERYGSGYRVRIGERWIIADLVDAGAAVRSLRLEDGTQYSLLHHSERSDHFITSGGVTYQIEVVDPLALRRGGGADMGGDGVVKALMPGRIARVLVAKGESVRKGQGLLVLEAMKMENEIQAPFDGMVDQLFVEPGQTVESGADLVHLSDA